MTTDWTVSTSASELKLNALRQGELTFSVTNPGPGPDNAYFFAEVDSDDPAVGGRQPWLSVDEPQQSVAPGQTVSYLLKVAVPNTFPAGKYFLKGVAYSANTAAEETRRDSGRVAFEVAPGKPPSRWWIWVVAAVLVLTVVGVGAWFLLKGDDTPTPTASPTPSPSPIPGAPQTIFREAESLIGTATVTGVGKDQLMVQDNCCGFAWSNNRQAFFRSGQGSSVTFRITVVQEYDYRLSMARTTSWDYADTVTEVDGKQIGNIFPGYTPNVLLTNVTDGTVHLTPGEHTITIKALGRNAASAGFFLGVDTIRLEPVGKPIIVRPINPSIVIVVPTK